MHVGNGPPMVVADEQHRRKAVGGGEKQRRSQKHRQQHNYMGEIPPAIYGMKSEKLFEKSKFFSLKK